MSIFNKKDTEIKKFCLSEDAIKFIQKYVVNELSINKPIDEEKLDEIISLATDWELDMIDPNSKYGSDKQFDYPEKERNELADKFVGEITGKWDDDKLIPDFNDLNKRLGLE